MEVHMLAQQILRIITRSKGIKAADIAAQLPNSLNSVSGTLSNMKDKGLVINCYGKWHLQSTKFLYIDRDRIINEDMVKSHLEGVNKPTWNKAWCEGYICGLAMAEVITDEQEEELLDWITSK
jgi:hypothetical protein